MNAQELYRAGKLAEAIASQNDEVRSHPTDVERRSFLSELLCIAGNLERADTQLEAIEKMRPGSGPALALIRQLIRAEKTRQEVHAEGRAPDFFPRPTRHLQLCAEAAVALRAGDAAAAARLASEAVEARPHVSGTCDGKPFEDFRDLDDLTGGIFEVLTSTGRYVWIPMEDVISIEFDAPEQPLDLLWRPAAMSVRDGPDGKVFLPTVYRYEGAGVDDAARLGRRTEWVQTGANGAVRGIGLRTFLVGEEDRNVLEISQVSFGG